MSPETASCAFAGDAAGAGGALGAGAVLEIGEGPGAIAGWQAGPSAPSSAASASRMPRRRVVTAAVVIEPIIEPIIENAAPVVKRGPSSGRPAVRYAVSRRSTSTKNRHGQRGPDADRGRGARAVRLWHPAPGRPVSRSGRSENRRATWEATAAGPRANVTILSRLLYHLCPLRFRRPS